MNLTARFATTMSLAVLLALGVPGCAKEKATPKAASAPEAPLSKGLRDRYSGTCHKACLQADRHRTGSVGPGDLYSLLATGKETNNALFQFEAIVPKGGGPPPHVHSREDESRILDFGFWTRAKPPKSKASLALREGTVRKLTNPKSRD